MDRLKPHFLGKQSVSIVLSVLNVVAPVFVLASIGFIWVKIGLEYRVEFITRLAMTLSVPCLIFVALTKTEIDPNSLSDIVLATIVGYGVLTAVTYVFVRLFKINVSTYLPPLIFGNTGNLGLPLALFAFGDVGLGYAVVIFAVMAVYSFTFGIWVVSGGGSLTKVIREPIVGATLLGGLFLYNSWRVPTIVENTLGLIGQMAIPLMLITLGVAVARLRPAGIFRSLLMSLLKVVIGISIAFVVGRFFGLAPIPFAVLILQLSTPVAVTSYLMAEKYADEAEIVAGLVVVSTMVSVFTIPLTLAFLM